MVRSRRRAPSRHEHRNAVCVSPYKNKHGQPLRQRTQPADRWSHGHRGKSVAAIVETLVVPWNRHRGRLTEVLTRHIGWETVNQRVSAVIVLIEGEIPHVRDNSDVCGMSVVGGGVMPADPAPELGAPGQQQPPDKAGEAAGEKASAGASAQNG